MHTLSAQRLREAAGRARRPPPELLREQRRCRFRVINLPGERGEARRQHIQASCLDCLREALPLLDAGFTDGVVARELHWQPCSSGARDQVQTTTVNGQVYVVDQEIWHGPTRNEAERMSQEYEAGGWNPSLWRAFLQDCSEPNSWGYVGCQLAHVEAWRAALAAGADWLMLCEDDVCPTPLFGMSWAEIWMVVAEQIQQLRVRGEAWDLLFVGKGSSVSPEGRMLTPLVAECGYNIKMHCYCISRRGMARLLSSRLPYTAIRPQDEILAALNVRGAHPRRRLREKVSELFPEGLADFRSLCFPWWGIVFQLQHFERHRSSPLCKSAIGELGEEGAPGVSGQ